PMDYSLMPIYVLSFINFRIGHEDDGILQEGLVSSYKICSPKTGEVMTDALYFGFVELGRLEVPFGKPGAVQDGGGTVGLLHEVHEPAERVPEGIRRPLVSTSFSGQCLRQHERKTTTGGNAHYEN
ncbi:MAG: hypothetical protein II824_05795, partial [Bacteroidales bacterium]|nr:hypothetical protein [Bacteroidales bacterium]